MALRGCLWLKAVLLCGAGAGGAPRGRRDAR
eukprot:CAMPEP_0185558506 /NCGR_PEP_ID=MMETSP1381-20130426/52438_1 /TAXON_ID=298111 /ORGANISM="Pavlova sp., Strain CCMP459" /LENGTH=30 /DNA_ID= /DNA_START= /DNA_END= /DNA_ORIENTATION=